MINWQMPLTLVLIAAAGAYLIRTTIRRWRPNSTGCAGGCCDKRETKNSTVELIKPEELVLRVKQPVQKNS
jgi:hypothetical protein